MFIVLMIGILLCGACTEQSRAKSFGGTANIDLPKGEKLINVTWKGESHIWYLTRPMTESDKAETYNFRESSSFGIIQGKVTLVEHK